MSQDAKSKSATEAFVNSFGSYPIGYGLGIVILPITMGWLQDDLFVANLFVTLIYATVSFVRTYYLRRVFEQLGFDDNFIKLAIKLKNYIHFKSIMITERLPVYFKKRLFLFMKL